MQGSSHDEDVGYIFELKKELKLDPDQRDAIVHSLDQSVSLIHGPPGTGKSFCGALVSKLIYTYTTLTILCVCYTNHAIDQFLENLLDIGIDASKVLRIGSNLKVSDRIKPMCIQDEAQRTPFSSSDGRVYGLLKTTIESLRLNIEITRNRVEEITRNLGYRYYIDHIEEEYPFVYEALTLPDSNDGMQRAKGKGAMKNDELWKMWTKNIVPKKHIMVDITDYEGVWNWSAEMRQKQIDQWTIEILEPHKEKLLSLLSEYEKSNRLLNNLTARQSSVSIGNVRIIGCTTSGAAKYRATIEKFSPQVVIVEEAGEILGNNILNLNLS